MSIKLAGLTANQVQQLEQFDLQIRSAVLAKFTAQRLANAAINQYNDTIVQIISLLDGTELLPTQTGLASAAPFAESDPGYVISYLTPLTTYDSATIAGQMAIFTKACGALNLLGGE